MIAEEAHAASFRDPSGFIFEREGTLYRQVCLPYAEDWKQLHESGLLERLTEQSLLVSHQNDSLDHAAAPDAVAVVRPERVPFVSYPYEWSFAQLKDAALLTLQIAETALAHGMVLKDATAYNVQFLAGRPILIDTLSFERYVEGEPWIAYGQFCRHFLAPLALMSRVDVRLGGLTRVHLDGIPLDLASRLLPWRSKLDAGLAMHLHMHAKALSLSGKKGGRKAAVSRTAFLGLLDHLKKTVQGLKWEAAGTEWADYYSETNYSEDSMARKRQLVGEMIEAAGPPALCWDLGANTGEFSRLAAERGWNTVSWDVDPGAVQRAHAAGRDRADSILPLLLDLTNPSPSQGWAQVERMGLRERGPADLLLMLALVHHLAIGNNVPLPRVFEFARQIGRTLVIEFVPKSDSQVQRMLSSRRDIFDRYDIEHFREAASTYFAIEREEAIRGTERTLFLMRGLSA